MAERSNTKQEDYIFLSNELKKSSNNGFIFSYGCLKFIFKTTANFCPTNKYTTIHFKDITIRNIIIFINWWFIAFPDVSNENVFSLNKQRNILTMLSLHVKDWTRFQYISFTFFFPPGKHNSLMFVTRSDWTVLSVRNLSNTVLIFV